MSKRTEPIVGLFLRGGTGPSQVSVAAAKCIGQRRRLFLFPSGTPAYGFRDFSSSCLFHPFRRRSRFARLKGRTRLFFGRANATFSPVIKSSTSTRLYGSVTAAFPFAPRLHVHIYIYIYIYGQTINVRLLRSENGTLYARRVCPFR